MIEAADGATKRTRELLDLVKDASTVARDLLILLLILFLLCWPTTLNNILYKAGVTSMNLGVVAWKQKVQDSADQTKVAVNANNATASALDDVRTSLTAIASQSSDPKVKLQAQQALQSLDNSLTTLDYAGTTLKSSLATQQTILQATTPAQQSSTKVQSLQGGVYLGEADAQQQHWMIPPQPKISASSPVPKVGQTLTLTDDLYLRADKAANQTFNQATIIGVAHVGSVARVLDVQPSHALNGGVFLWAKIAVTENVTP
ncbi:MAG TPA: hypothetical protein VHZ52_13340 [Acidobacteriaceae bacterium]|jgi:hypothetical protein|nr:hypothetical protein [Acidobacteriaceae bacterium]